MIEGGFFIFVAVCVSSALRRAEDEEVGSRTLLPDAIQEFVASCQELTVADDQRSIKHAAVV